MSTLFLESDKVFLILWLTVSVNVPPSCCSVPTVIVVLGGCSSEIADEEIFLVIPSSVDFQEIWVLCVTDCFEHHIISLRESVKPYILHCLDKRKSFPQSLPCDFYIVLLNLCFVSNIILTPESHGKRPEKNELCETTMNKWSISEKSGSLLMWHIPNPTIWIMRHLESLETSSCFYILEHPS
ncbi:unnamed protein product [Moneuplotes crassus]|uniref:Secreted protein n=1 Tax=Euplotes crassus TaxID=5936 RepID=A0AAD1XYZ9_EUPCR|nr:unnamed protein product [Moneuplotes crassus]